MKIYTFTDLHSDIETLLKIKKKAKAGKAELILCAGDVSIFGSELKIIMKELNKINIPVLIIHGNHETVQEMNSACKGLKNIKFIHKKVYKHGNYKIIGYGGGGFAFTDSTFVKTMRAMKSKIKKTDKVILMTHQPPYGTKTDKIYNDYAGNKSFTSYIKKEQPKIAICGHLHENEGKKDKIGRTLVLNPGYQGVLLDV